LLAIENDKHEEERNLGFIQEKDKEEIINFSDFEFENLLESSLKPNGRIIVADDQVINLESLKMSI